MTATEELKIKWHPAFYCAMECVLRNEKDMLEFRREHCLSKEPIRMDLLVIDEMAVAKTKADCCRFFRKYNVIEYKSPDDGHNIDDFFKTIGYAALFKGMADKVRKYPAEDITVSLFQDKYPAKLIKDLKAKGYTIDKRYPGIYYIYGDTLFPVQIVVMGKTVGKDQAALRLLSKHVAKEDIHTFIDIFNGTTDAGEKSNVDAILQVSISANTEIFEEVRREDPMCEALRELMKDEIAAEVNAAVNEAVAREREENNKNILKLAGKMLLGGLSLTQVVEFTGLPLETIRELANKLGVEVMH